MNEITTTDFSKFGSREREMSEELLKASRIQGFPENFKLPEFRTPAYKQFGNSLVVPVVQKIGEEIIKRMEEVR